MKSLSLYTMFQTSLLDVLVFIACATASNFTVVPQRSGLMNNLVPYFYVVYQSLNGFTQNTAMAAFVIVPGLELALHHAQPILYRIMFQGGCQGSSGTKYVQILIDGRVRISNFLLPNTGQPSSTSASTG